MEQPNPILSEAAGWLMAEKAVLIAEPRLRTWLSQLRHEAALPEATRAAAAARNVAVTQIAAVSPTEGIVACIPVYGVLNKQYDWCGMCSTTRVLEQYTAALGDPAVGTICLDIDSPGGFVNGSVELADAIAAGNKQKRTVALVRGLCCSGAYWIASQCAQILTRAECEVGNIGVFSVLMDISEFYKSLGITLTTVASGQFKGLGADGRVTDDLVADTRRTVTGLCQQFINAVAAGRGLELADATALADGRAFLGPQAKQLRLADALFSTFGEAIDLATGAQSPEQESDMASATKTNGTPPQSNAATPPATAATAPAASPAPAVSAEKKDEGNGGHKVLDTTIESAKSHRAQVRSAMDYATDYEGEADDAMKGKAKSTIAALKATSAEADRCAKALQAHVDADDDDDDDDDKPKPTDDGDKDKKNRGAAGYIQAFGDVGAKWFVEGKSFTECATAHIAQLKTEHAAAIEKLSAQHKAEADGLKAENAELKKKLAAVDRGNDPVLASAPEQPKAGATSGNGQGPAKKINGLSPGLSRFAAGIRFSDKPITGLAAQN